MYTLTHTQAQKALHASLSQVVTPEQQAALEAHLAGCPTCRLEAERLGDLEAGLRRSLHARLDDQLRARPGPLTDPLTRLPTSERRPSMKPAFSLSSGVLLAVLLIGLAAALTWLLPRSGVIPGATTEAIDTPTPQAGALAVLPGGAQGLALFGAQREGNAEIFLLEASGKKYNLTQRPADDRFPSWSPDGKRIAFFSDGEGTPGQREMFLMNVDGSGLRQLTHTPAGEGWLSSIIWSPDGSRLALAHLSGVTGQSQQGVSFQEAQLYLVETVDGATTPLDNDQRHGLPGEAVWSPDGSRIAFTRGLESGGEELRVVQLGRPGSVKLAGISERFAGLAWSPDGKTLAYITHGPWIADNRPYRLAERATARLFLQPAGGGEAVLLQSFDPVPEGIQLMGWAPDGSRLIFLVNQGAEDCWQMQSIHPDGSKPTTLPMCAAFTAGRPVWTEDGWLLFPAVIGGDGQAYAVFALDPNNTGDPRQLASIRLADKTPLFIRPGLRLEALAAYAAPIPTAEPASTPYTGPGALVPPPQSVCDTAMQAVSERLKLAAQIEYDAPFQNADATEAKPANTGRGCEARWEGPMTYGSLQEVFDLVTPWLLSDQGYRPDSVGTGFRNWWGTYRKSYRMAQLEAAWQPLDSTACPDQDPASDCPLPGEQKRLEVILRLADDPLSQAIDESLTRTFERLAAGEAQALENLSPALRQQVRDQAGLKEALGMDSADGKFDFTFEVRSAGEDVARITLTVWQRFGRTQEWRAERLVGFSRQADGWAIESIQPSPP